jgi:DNA adenine methylase
VLRAVEHAQAVVARHAPEPVEKTIWGSPAGKKRIANRLVGMLPAHATYTEPFAGSAAVLFAKEPADTEAINDADEEIARAYKIIKRLSPRMIARLKKMAWVGDVGTFKGLIDQRPADDVAWLHRFLYVTHFSYGKLRGKSFSPSGVGVRATTIDRIEKFAPRLRDVHVYGGDYRKVVEKYDGKDTTHFLDPPYYGYNVDVGESAFDERAFFDVLKSLKGRFLITYGIRGELPKLVKNSDFEVRRIRTRRSIASMRGVGGSSILTQLLISNYGITQKQCDGLEHDGWIVDDTKPRLHAVPAAIGAEAPRPAGTPAEGSAPTPTSTSMETAAFSASGRLVKGIDPEDERFVLGIVLEPETVDAQGDIYSAEEIRQAAHRFMEEFGGLGLMHRLAVNDQVKVLESYLAPIDFDLGEVKVKKGTWLLGVRVLSDELWGAVKDGGLTGFSIGGHARKQPETAASIAPAEDAPDADREVSNG